MMSFFTTELTRGYLLERDKAKFSERRERVYTFMKTPRELEKVLRCCIFHERVLSIQFCRDSIFNCIYNDASDCYFIFT